MNLDDIAFQCIEYVRSLDKNGLDDLYAIVFTPDEVPPKNVHELETILIEAIGSLDEFGLLDLFNGYVKNPDAPRIILTQLKDNT